MTRRVNCSRAVFCSPLPDNRSWTIVVLAFIRSDALGRSVLAAAFVLFFFYDLFSWHLSAFLLFTFVGFAAVRDRRDTESHDVANTEVEQPLTQNTEHTVAG
jgi:hypothetical protein